jgi:hypothetical protein
MFLKVLCGDDLAARGAPAAAGDASDRVSSVLHRLTQRDFPVPQIPLAGL